MATAARASRPRRASARRSAVRPTRPIRTARPIRTMATAAVIRHRAGQEDPADDDDRHPERDDRAPTARGTRGGPRGDRSGPGALGAGGRHDGQARHRGHLCGRRPGPAPRCPTTRQAAATWSQPITRPARPRAIPRGSNGSAARTTSGLQGSPSAKTPGASSHADFCVSGSASAAAQASACAWLSAQADHASGRQQRGHEQTGGQTRLAAADHHRRHRDHGERRPSAGQEGQARPRARRRCRRRVPGSGRAPRWCRGRRSGRSPPPRIGRSSATEPNQQKPSSTLALAPRTAAIAPRQEEAGQHAGDRRRPADRRRRSGSPLRPAPRSG